ncbi:MAG: hypothetical protein KBS63_01495 [Clostridiales bacterium]|nr:hypothetical protein [Candidatus Crickella caballi]
MGGGRHGGFGNTGGSIHLPNEESQIKHIFGDRPGHLPDTQKNRELLVNLAQDKTKFIGKDKYGNSWNAEETPDGKQNWVRYKNNVINEGGQNKTPREWDPDTGLNNNPFKNKKKGKK